MDPDVDHREIKRGLASAFSPEFGAAEELTI